MKKPKPLETRKPLKGRKSLGGTKPLKAKTSLKKSGKTSKKQPKPTITKLKKEADIWHSKATRYRFAEKVNGVWMAHCITCPPGSPMKPIANLQCGHFMSRQYNIVRFSEENTAPQCYGCNVMQQGKQYLFGLEVDKLYGQGTAQRLLEESRTPHQFKQDELELIIADRKAEVAFYEEK